MTLDPWLVLAGALVGALAPTAASIYNARKIREVHLSLNSRLDALVKAAHAEGRQHERDEQGRE